jgi:hypothetical protein
MFERFRVSEINSELEQNRQPNPQYLRIIITMTRKKMIMMMMMTIIL